jgi:hypothetical protein
MRICVGYQDVVTLAKYYKVSADYLFGMTDNRQYRNITIDELTLTDAAVKTLRDRKLNNRLVSELLSHPTAPQLFSAMEVYIDRKILPQMNNMNALYKFAEETIRERFDVADGDEHMKILQEAVVDEDEYLRYRITERFSALMKALFDAHKKDALPEDQAGTLDEIKDGFQTYKANKEKEGADRAKMIFWAKWLGLNISKLTGEEMAVFAKVVAHSEAGKKSKRR